MTPQSILDRVRAAAGTVCLNGDKLKLAAQRPLPDDLMADIKSHRAELLEYLAELDRLLARVAERYGWTAEDIAEARAGCARDPVGHREMFRAWLAEPRAIA